MARRTGVGVLLGVWLFGGFLGSGEPATLSAMQGAASWHDLFDGKTLSGWQAGTEVDWTVSGGVVSATRGDVGLLYTTEQYGDFQLRVDFRSAKGTNSGIFLRTLPRPTNVLEDCYELNIAPPDNPFPTGSFVGRQKVEGVEESDRWRTYEVTARGGDFQIKLDGQVILSYSDPEPIPKGHIGLQFNQGRIEFRNVKIRPL